MRYFIFLLPLTLLFPPVYDSEKEKGVPMPAEEAAARFKVPPGFRVSVFASEPDVQNPIACCWDARGRLWVAENYTYAEQPKKFDLNLRDRIIIFKDNGIGKKPDRTVFADDLTMLTSIEVGRGGVWCMCPPKLLFIPMKDGKPNGRPEVLLDGFTVAMESHHNFANGLKWGPDGWLYGRCGASCPGEVGIPGTPAAERIPLRGGIWRYHPMRKVFEALCHGTTNPWGHDWDERGECFFINTVGGHLWHMIPGAHYSRSHTTDPNPYVYRCIDQHADHWHWDTSKDWSDSRKYSPEHDKRGGGHAHVGMMIYNGTNWPKEYRGKLMTLNLHGRRVNVERLERHGSGFVGKHEPDMLFAADPFFRGQEITYGPDGSVFILDWSDTGECHENSGVHRTSGRIYRVTCDSPSFVAKRDLSKLDNEALAKLVFSTNPWDAQQARHVIRDREIDMVQLLNALERGRHQQDGIDEEQKELRFDWATSTKDLFWMKSGNRKSKYESVRSFEIDNLTSRLEIDRAIDTRFRELTLYEANFHDYLVDVAKSDPSALVRLHLASALQRLSFSWRVDIASALVAHKDDAHDHNLPLMVWYGLIPVAKDHPEDLVKVAAVCEWPLTRRYIARRLAEDIERRPAPINEVLMLCVDRPEAFASDVLAGIVEGTRGMRRAVKPQAWDAVAGKFPGFTVVRDLSVLFGDGRALDEVRRIALNDKEELETRKAALRTLIAAKPDDLRTTCEALLKVKFLNSVAVKGLALFDDPQIGGLIVQRYGHFHPSERGAVIDVLVSRPALARTLLDAVAQKRIAKEEITASHARQIASFNESALTGKLASVWGPVRATPADKRAAIEGWKKKLGKDTLTQADLKNGAALFEKSCASCHRLYGKGGTIGPELTGANRDNLDFLLDNIIDPGAILSADFRVTKVTLFDGRVFNGIVKTRTADALTLQLEKEVITVRIKDIEAEALSEQSLMPDNLLTPMKNDEVRDLIAYLQKRG